VRIRILTPAREEFLEAVTFYEREARGLGSDFIDEFERALELIATNPHLGPHFEADSRRKLLQRFPFQIIYEVESGEILVVAIAHLSRRPGYWQDRLQ
jgi:plasmid stabilization system protein ParE